MAAPSTDCVNFKHWSVIIYFSSAVHREFVLQPNFLELRKEYVATVSIDLEFIICSVKLTFN